MTEDFSTDIAIEALDVLINHILYIRGVYPKEIFQRKKIYNCPVFVSIYPNLNEYLAKVLTIARALKAEKQLNKVEVLIYKDQNCVYETYAFEITNKSYIETSNTDQYLMNLEEQLRVTMHTLSERVMSLGKLPEDAKVKLQLHTKQSTYIKACKNSYTDIPWLQVSVPSYNTRQKNILPLKDLKECGINMSVEI